jgi:hypothetical protein
MTIKKKAKKKDPPQTQYPATSYPPPAMSTEEDDSVEGRVLRLEEFCHQLAERLRRHGIHVDPLE